MDAEELAQTTTNKENRHLIRLSLKDVGEAEHIVSILMGTNILARKEHIENKINNLFN